MTDVKNNLIGIFDKVLTFNSGKEIEIGKILSINTVGQAIIQLKRNRVKRYSNQFFLIETRNSGNNNACAQTIN